MNLYPYEKGVGQVSAMLKGGSQNAFWAGLSWELEVLAILKEGPKSVNPKRGQMRKVLPCLEGRAQNILGLRFFHFVAPLPVIKGQ